MITTLGIRRFKCFSDADFSLRPLTVLTGLNGAGKSTVIQSLLLARQAAAVPAQAAIQLNGPYGLALGEAQELLHPESPVGSGIEILIHEEDRDPQASGSVSVFRFAVPRERALHLDVAEAPITSPKALSLPGSGFTYLCAERLGPRDMLSVSAQPPDDLGVGVRGEHTAQVLALREMRPVGERKTVREPLLHSSTSVPLLRTQTEAWASHIIRPIRVAAQWAPGLAATTIRFQETGLYGEEIRPANTGFGLSYALPVIVAGLLTQPGDVLIVENPEAHLHPAGQSRLGRFLAQVAGSGAQVIVETHSDHVVNGARLAVAEDGSLAAADTLVHYFDRDGVVPIELTDRGELTRWPDGFFDQIEGDLGRLARARRRR